MNLGGKSAVPAGTATEVFLAFLRLGCSSFGGPVAHLGYFRSEFVERRRWCSDETFAEIVALAQALPGPASSQTGFTIGLLRAGLAGGIAAFLGFTSPSALLMLLFALGHNWLNNPLGSSIVHGLQLVAVAVVAQAILAMRRTLAPDGERLAIALAGLGLTLAVPAFWGSLAVIACGAVAGFAALKKMPESSAPVMLSPLPRAVSVVAGCSFLGCFFAPATSLFGAFYRTGALVFGGGHVVLPLLEKTVVATGWVEQSAFLAGYGAAQALPGPLFTFAMYLGAVAKLATAPVWSGLVALLGIFLPGLLLIVALLPAWAALRRNPSFRPALAGVNAAVLGILGAAFYRPIYSSSVHSSMDFFLVVAAFFALTEWMRPPWQVVGGMAVLSAVFRWVG